MKAVRKTRIAAVLAGALALLGAAMSASSADNPPAENIGWLYVPDLDMVAWCGKAYFDGDANGAPGKERVAVKAGCTGLAYVRLQAADGKWFKCDGETPNDNEDPGQEVCTKNAFPEGMQVLMQVCFFGGPDFAKCGKWEAGRA